MFMDGLTYGRTDRNFRPTLNRKYSRVSAKTAEYLHTQILNFGVFHTRPATYNRCMTVIEAQ